MDDINGSPSTSNNISNSSQKRPAQDEDESHRKRAKYTLTACNECKRCKVKCIRLDNDVKCQRCTTMSVACIVIPTASQLGKEKDRDKQQSRLSEPHFKLLSNDIASLRDQVSTLTATVASLVERQAMVPTNTDHQTPVSQSASSAYTTNAFQQPKEPKQPRFVGPTRSDFSFHIAETSLTRMGISPNDPLSSVPSSKVSSREASPVPVPQAPSSHPLAHPDHLLTFSNEEVLRLVGIYQEEVACVHPIIEVKDLIANTERILEFARNPRRGSIVTDLLLKDLQILRLAVATAITHEVPGKNEISDQLIVAVEQNVGMLSNEDEVDLKDIQIVGMLSLYFCHTSEELFAWRAIGRAARQCLEMGLHRKQSLFDNFKDPSSRALAVQVFWVVYELDRRWSFGTSLSFALNDRDIDPQLPEPGNEYPYLKCMVAYARVCSRVWEALPPYGSSLQLIPKETEDYLDFITQNWLLSIPPELRYNHPRPGFATQAQSRPLHRLRTLLYLRGNYMRTLIHRHHVLTPDNVKSDLESAHLVVDVAKDSIQILIHLNETSNIYKREQSIYHYYLLSALAVVLLAVCHAPSTFATDCRDSFISAVELIKGFSNHSTASRRLWKSLRGLLPVIKSLWKRADRDPRPNGHGLIKDSVQILQHVAMPTHRLSSDVQSMEMPALWTNNLPSFDASIDSMPDISNMSNDLLDLYDVFGSAAIIQPMEPNASTDDLGEQGMSLWEIEEVSRHFQGLL